METGYYAGIDIGSRMTKAAVITGEGVCASRIVITRPEQRKLAHEVMEAVLADAGVSLSEVTYVVATGYGRINVPFADRQITEISCHARGISFLMPTVRTVIDIGGQDSKGIKVSNGKAVDFVMNDKCAAGTGRFIEIIAESLGVCLEDVGRMALEATDRAVISSTCTVFAEQEAVSALSRGVPVGDILAGVLDSIATRVCRMVNRLKAERDVAFTGGGAKNSGLVRMLEEKLGMPVLVPDEPLITGALGAALLGRDIVEKAEAKGTASESHRRALREVTFFND